MDTKIWSLLLFVIMLSQALSSAIDNSLADLPDVICGPDSIHVSGQTEYPFRGVVYIKNWRRNDPCFSSYNNASSMVKPSLEVELSSLAECGMEMTRKPATREVEISGVWVFSFHPRFVTKVDRAFSIHCIFKQKEITVTNSFDINDIVTRDTIHGTADMPNIYLKIIPGLEPIMTKDPAEQVRVGDPISLIWYTPIASEMYGIRVEDCFVETLKGSRVKIIQNGCSLDEVVVSELRSSPDVATIFATSHAFKFADAADVWFKCTVAACMKHTSMGVPSKEASCIQNTDCKRVRSKRDVYRRSISQNFMEPATISVNDLVAEQRLLVLDYYNQHAAENVSIKALHKNKGILLYQPVKRKLRNPPYNFCMRKPIFALVTSVIVLMYITAFILSALSIIMYFKRKNVSEFQQFDISSLASRLY